MCQNIRKSLYNYWLSLTYSQKIDITNPSVSKDIDQLLFDLRCQNPLNLHFAYLNINSVRNIFENLIEIINKIVEMRIFLQLQK